jgi:hypothetical protein
MYGDVVLGVQKREGEDHEPFETVIEEYKHESITRTSRQRSHRRRPAGTREALQAARQRAHWQGVSQAILGISFVALLAPSSVQLDE